ncbi:MAG: TonB family protein [Dongiaceae bacterium]
MQDDPAETAPSPPPLTRDASDGVLRAEGFAVEANSDVRATSRMILAILAALLLHLASFATLIERLPLETTTPEPPPIPVELAFQAPEEPPPPPPPPEKPPEPQQPMPDLRSGGDLADRDPGSAPEAPADAAPPPEPAPVPELPEQTPAPASEPIPPPTPAQEPQQAMMAPPLPPKKPPEPVARTAPAPTEAPTQTATAPDNADMYPGEGGGDLYLNAMRDKIMRNRVYPPTAELFGLNGYASYEIDIDRQGRLLAARVIESTGYEILDKAGLQTIRKSAPFDPVPDEIPGNRIRLTLGLRIGPR